MADEFLLNLIVDQIHMQPELRGVRVGFRDACQSRMIHLGDSSAPNYGRVVVVIEEIGNPLPSPQPAVRPRRAVPKHRPARPAHAVLTHQLPYRPEQAQPAAEPTALPQRIRNSSRVYAELGGAAISCTVTVLSVGALIVGGATTIPTGGAGAALVILGWVGAASSGLACVNGVVRTVAAVSDPDSNSLQEWDESGYALLVFLNDGVGLATGVASLPRAAQSIYRLFTVRGLLPSSSAMARMRPPQRAAALREALQRVSRNSDDAAELSRALREAGFDQNQIARLMAGELPRSMRVAGGATRVTGATEVVSRTTGRALQSAIQGVVATSAGATGSALPSYVSGSASGVVNALIVHVIGVESGTIA